MSEGEAKPRGAWGPTIAYGYVLMLGAAVLLGYVAGDLINKGGILAADPIAIVSWFVLFPAYVILDGILNARFFTCPVRAALLPLVQGFVIMKVSGEGGAFGVSQLVAFGMLALSFVVVGITRGVRGPATSSRES